MPLYEYGCSACGEVSEISHRLADPAPVECPACGAPKLSKLISAAGFRLKGEGWYETDFKSGGKRNLAGDSAASGASGESKSESKSEAKPAAASSDGGGTKSASPSASPAASGS